ncbi:MAG: acetyl-coenzyme A synthetase, partial [Gemmatirosa sp.]|nr:acetyl-coenzyme A synthetase [Gemmatirosa sp.]
MRDDIDVLLREDRSFPPPDAFRAAALVSDDSMHEEGARDPDAFWARMARELAWMTPFTRTLDWTPPHATWFADGTLNASANCVDR